METGKSLQCTSSSHRVKRTETLGEVQDNSAHPSRRSTNAVIKGKLVHFKVRTQKATSNDDDKNDIRGYFILNALAEIGWVAS